MVPPGDSLEFTESKYFEKVIAPDPALRGKIVDHLKSWPADGTEFATGVRELKMTIDGEELAIIYRRTGNRLALMHLYVLPQDEAKLKATKAEVIKVFGPRARS